MTYYHDIVTWKSWEELQNLQRTTRFVLIVLTTYHLDAPLQKFFTLLGERGELPELGLNAHAYSKLKKRILISLRV